MGATIMGRNMFGPVRGPWRDPRSLPSEQWTGWWGDEPPFHHPVFVLTHHPRESLTMAGGTTFHFVGPNGIRGGLNGLLDLAFEAAGGQDVRLGGGVVTIQQFLRAGLIDEMGWPSSRCCWDAASGCSTISVTKRSATSASRWSVQHLQRTSGSSGRQHPRPLHRPSRGPLPERASIGIRMAGAIAAWAIGACRVNPACRPASPACQPGRPLCQLARLTCWQPLPNT